MLSKVIIVGILSATEGGEMKFFYATYRALHLRNPLIDTVHVSPWKNIQKVHPIFSCTGHIQFIDLETYI